MAEEQKSTMKEKDLGGFTRREFLKVFGATIGSAVLSTSAACPTLPPSQISDHFRVYSAPIGYAQQAEKALEDLTGFLGHPYYGVIEIWTSGTIPYTTRGPAPNLVPRIDMPLSRFYSASNADPLVHELVRAVVNYHEPLWTRGLAVVSQRILQPNKSTFPLFGGDVHLSVSSLGVPSDVLDVRDRAQYIIDGSFVGYLIEQYGIEKFVDFTNMNLRSFSEQINFPKREQIIYGKSIDDLLGEWREKVQKNPNRKPLEIKFTPQRKSYDEDMLKRHKGKVVVIGDENIISQSGLQYIENDAIEAYDFLAKFFGYDLPNESRIKLDITRNAPPSVSWTKNGDINMSVQRHFSLRGNYNLVGNIAYRFIESPRNLASRSAALYLCTLKPTLGGLKSRAPINYGIDIDKLAKEYIDDLIPLNQMPYRGKDQWKDYILQFIQAGSFGRWVVNNYARGDAKKGVAMLSQVARGATYESVFGASLETMERGWIKHLKS